MNWRRLKQGFGEYEGKAVIYHVNGSMDTIDVARTSSAAWYLNNGYIMWMPVYAPEMKNHDLTVNITGAAGAGTTSLALYIARCLMMVGVEVDIDDADIDNLFDKLQDVDAIDRNMEAIASRTEVQINVKRAARQDVNSKGNV